MRAVELARCLCTPGALGFEWAGDRANTLTKSLDERELRAILGPVLGWVVPEKEQRVGKRKVQRRERCAHAPTARPMPSAVGRDATRRPEA